MDLASSCPHVPLPDISLQPTTNVPTSRSCHNNELHCHGDRAWAALHLTWLVNGFRLSCHISINLELQRAAILEPIEVQSSCLTIPQFFSKPPSIWRRNVLMSRKPMSSISFWTFSAGVQRWSRSAGSQHVIEI